MVNVREVKDISKEKFKIEVVTPLFLGGADQIESEIRISSIKGAIRFWWRAIYGRDYNLNNNEMYEKEGEIFGSTERKSSFSLMLESENIDSKLENLPKGITFTPKGKKFSVGIIDYLAFGLRDFKKGYLRKHITPKSTFDLQFTFYKNNYKNEILNSFYHFIKYGSLGSKARNGFGCLKIKDNSIKLEKIDLKNKELSEFTSFSKESKLFIGTKKDRWEDALSEIGLIYKDARLSIERRHEFEKRGLVAMPIEARNENIPSYIKNGRHTKPYFLHVNKLENEKFQGKILFLKYDYYNDDKREEYNEVHQEICDFFKKNLKEDKI